jgi:hypothetical protein
VSRYAFRFHGRLNGALGVSGIHNVEVEAETEEAARLRLYETHEHVSVLTVKVRSQPRLMVAALYAPYRTLPCEHKHMPYRGSMACTGPRACTMCGATEYALLEEQTPARGTT